MNNRLTKYGSFEAMKQNIHPTALSALEKAKLDAEAKQMAEIFQALRASKQNGNTRK